MKPKQVAPFGRFGKTVLSLVLALPVAGTLLYAHTRDTPIDYSSFRSAAEARAAALRRVEETIQALSAPGVAASGPSGDTPVTAAPMATAEASVDTLPEDPGLAASQPDRAVPPPQAHSVSAGQTPPPTDPLADRVLALGDASLDEVRGGFDVPGSHLTYTFGIERAVFINGELVARTVLKLQDLGTVAGRGAPVQELTGVNGAAATVDVIQNGPGNNFTAQVGPNMVGTVIQNTLDNQKIQQVTTINATVNSLQMMRAMSVQSAVQSGIVGSLRR